MSSTLTDMVNWLKSWFYTENEIDTLLASKQDTLVSGSNLKTVNGNSLLGSGNVVIEGGGTGVDIVTDWEDPTSDEKVASEKLTKDTLDTKQDILISGSTIKTINNQSVLGSGNITIESGSNVDIVTSWNSTTSDSKVPSEKLAKDSLDNKVDKQTGKGLSTNDFTNSYKSTIDGLSTVATTGDYDDLIDKPTIPSKTSDLANDSGFITSSSLPTKVSDLQNDTGFITSSALPTKTSDLTNDGDGTNAFLTQHQSLTNYIQKSSTSGLVKNDGTIDTTSYSTFSGSYNDLSNKPTIPTKISDLTNDSDFIEKSNTSGLVKNDGTIDTSTYLTSSALSNYVQKSSTNGLLKNDGTVDTTSYSTFSGSYSDLSNKPSIPSSSSDLSDGSDLVKKSSTTGLIKNDGSVDSDLYVLLKSIECSLLLDDNDCGMYLKRDD